MAPATESGQKAALKKGKTDPPATLRRSTRTRKSTRPFDQEEDTKHAVTKAEAPKTITAHSPEEPSEQPQKESPAQSPKQSPAQSPKQSPVQSPKQSPVQSPKQSSPQEPSPQPPKEPPAGSPKTTPGKSPKTTPAESPEETAPVRRNPKRKVTPEVFDVPDYLLETALEAWKENELEEWPSWAEVESDPAFFNRILRLIGVEQARIQESFGIDEDSLINLPDPLYGLIFLYQYSAPDEDPNPVEPSDDLWFANQTTTNACATVAMLNIMMNTEGLALGDRLERFKQETQDLSPPLRGHKLSNCTWLRVAANSFCRRIDLLNSALYLQQKSDSESKKKRRPAKKRKTTASSATSKKTETRKKAETRKNTESASYHFIAYVPLHNKVWQLDGLEEKPRCIGAYEDGQHWTTAVCDALRERVEMSESQQVGFSLLALHGDTSFETEGEADEKTGRKKDHTPAIHEWVRRLADRGVLGQLAAKVQRNS